MKKILFIVFCTISICRLSAQDKGDVQFGANAGLNISTVSTGLFSAEPKISFNVGGQAEYFFSDRWGIKARLIYDQKGWADGFLYDEFNEISVTTDYALNYLSVPITANWHFGGKRQWYLNFGPYVAFLLKAEATEADFDVTEGFSSIDAGLAYGIGYQFEISQGTKLYIEYEGQGGFLDVFEDNTGGTALNSRSSVNLGVLFGI